VEGLASPWRVEREASIVSLWCLGDADRKRHTVHNKARSCMSMHEIYRDNAIVGWDDLAVAVADGVFSVIVLGGGT
jgi:hypothetical protein